MVSEWLIYFPSTLVKQISHNQLKKAALFFTFGHSSHSNLLKKSHTSGLFPVLRKRTHIIYAQNDARQNKFVLLQFLRYHSREVESRSAARYRGQYFVLWIVLMFWINFFIDMIGKNQMQRNRRKKSAILFPIIFISQIVYGNNTSKFTSRG